MLQWSKSINSSCVLCIAVFEKIIEVSDILLFCTVCFECKGLDLASQWWSWNIHIYIYYIIIFNIGINPPQNSLLEFSFLFYIDLQWINNYCVLSSCDCCQSFASNQFFIEGLTIVRQDKAQDIVFCPQTMGFTFGGIISDNVECICMMAPLERGFDLKSLGTNVDVMQVHYCSRDFPKFHAMM